MIRPLVFGTLLWAICIYALRRGGTEERIAALGMFLNSYLTLLVVSPFATRFTHVELPIAIVVIALSLLLLWISLRSRKFWPLWLTAMQVLSTLAHFAPYVPHIIPWAYGSAVALWMYLMLIVLGFAIHRGQRERQNDKSVAD